MTDSNRNPYKSRVFCYLPIYGFINQPIIKTLENPVFSRVFRKFVELKMPLKTPKIVCVSDKLVTRKSVGNEEILWWICATCTLNGCRFCATCRIEKIFKILLTYALNGCIIESSRGEHPEERKEMRK